MAETRREYLQRRHAAMKTERSSFDAHWKECAEFIQPRMGRFFITDVNKGDRRWRSIINSTGTKAHEVARAGLHSGLMSPARPWFVLDTTDPSLMESQAVKVWLADVEMLLRTVFAKSNLYNMAPVMLGELLLFGTGAMFHLDDFDTVSRFYTMTVGQYCLSQNDKLQVDTISREYQMTVRQLVARFKDKVSTSVQNAYDKGNYEDRFDVIHIIEPNSLYTEGDPRATRMPFASCYMEAADNSKTSILSESGFMEFPVHCPRWDVTGEDVYATNCPGMAALGDVKGLQVAERRLAQAIDKQVNPPLKGPASLRGEAISSLPGGLTLYDESQTKLEPIYTVNPQTQELGRNIERHEMRIKRTFHEDLFMSMASIEGIQPQNELYLTQQRQEALLQLGPMLERVHGEFLTYLIDRTFNQCARAGILPPAPPELAGRPLQVRYVSALAMAQRSVATGGIDRLSAFVGGLAGAGYGQVVDKFDADQAVDEYAMALGVPPKLVVSDEAVAQMRQDRAAKQQQAQAMALAQQGAEAAKSLSQAQLETPSALSALTGGQANAA